jgi:hypothetical protein
MPQSEPTAQDILDAIAKSEAGIHKELASIRQELAGIDRSIQYLAKHLLPGSQKRELKRVAAGGQ